MDIKFNQLFFEEISNSIYNFLKNQIDSKNEDNLIVSKDLLNKLLEDDHISDDDIFFNNNPNCKDIFNYNSINSELFFNKLCQGSFYYPPKPFYKHVGLVLYSWMTIKKFPIQLQPLYGLYEVKKSEQEKNNIYSPDQEVIKNQKEEEEEEKKEKEQKEEEENQFIYFENLNEYILNNLSIDNNNNNNEKIQQVLLNVFKNLTNRDLLSLFSIRKTKLSLDTILLPGPIQLVKSSNLLNLPNSNSKLTVSSKALSKHAIRSKDSFWGSDKGPELIKNTRSEAILIEILKEPSWINIHLLPHNLSIIEVRNSQGYGLRWSADGSFFRGFLEPQMEGGGHSVHWRH